MSVKLSVCANVAEEVVSIQGLDSAVHAERADHEPVIAPVRLEREAPIRRQPVERPRASNGSTPKEFSVRKPSVRYADASR